MLSNHAYLSLVIPPQDRILLAIALLCIAAVLSYFLVKALLYSAEHESDLYAVPGSTGIEKNPPYAPAHRH